MPRKYSTERESEGTNSTESNDVEPIAPDGGWAWVILLASFLSSVIVDGVCFSFGIFYLEFLQHFGANKGQTAWIGSVLNGMYMIMGPISAALSNRYGCRPVAMVGSLWAATAFFLSTFSNNINTLIFTYGVLGGIGFGLMYLPSIVTVGHYFDKKRASATGIATCGSGIGAFIFAPMCQILIQTYAWKGAQWIIAGIVLNGVILGTSYRPLTDRDMEPYRQAWRKRRKLTESSSSCVQVEEPSQRPFLPSTTLFSDINPEVQETLLKTKKCHSSEDLAINVKDNKLRQTCVYSSHPHLYAGNDNSTKQLHKHGPVMDSWHGLTAYASVESIQHGRPTDPRHDRNKTDGHDNDSNPTATKSCFDPIISILSEISASMDLRMLKNPVFLIYAFSCILCMKGFFVPFIYLIDRAVELGYSEGRAAMLLSILGVTNTVGRVVTGWMSDRSWADCLMINNVALIIGGISTILVPYCNHFVLLACYASIFGLCIAAFVSLRSIILVDLIGLERLTSTFGILVLCQGITSFVGAPIAGSLYDLTGSYDVSFYVAGTSIALAGVICLPLRSLAKWLAIKESVNAASDQEVEMMQVVQHDENSNVQRNATTMRTTSAEKHFSDEL